LGFDSRTNDYKVVKISGMKVNHHVQVFSLTAGSWKSSIRVGAPLRRFRSRFESRPFINGAIHWLTITKTGTDVFNITVLSFEVSNETFREIILPKETEFLFPWPMLFSITVYENSLAVRVGRFA
jgi:F-box interacting protein